MEWPPFRGCLSIEVNGKTVGTLELSIIRSSGVATIQGLLKY